MACIWAVGVMGGVADDALHTEETGATGLGRLVFQCGPMPVTPGVSNTDCNTIWLGQFSK